MIRIYTACILLCFFAAPAALTQAQETNALAAGRRLNWPTHSHDNQHSGVSSVASQPLTRIHWHTRVDLQPQFTFGDLFTHYGSPIVTTKNTVVIPVKTGAFDGFRVDGRDGVTGTLKWRMKTDYSVDFAGVIPSCGPVLSKDRVVVPGAGGTVLIRKDDDDAQAGVVRVAFYGLDNFNANPTAFANGLKINTPITADANGNLYFGFIIVDLLPIPLQNGIARIAADGTGSWIAAIEATGDLGITQVNMNCAPALSRDEKSLYVGVSSGDFGFGYLLQLDAITLRPLSKVRLQDPVSHQDALITDQSSATPTVGPDGDVFFGVLENPFPLHNDRGWLLHFSGDLKRKKIPGSFGWDNTASVVAASVVPCYHGTSTYLLMTKYNNYASRGGDGVNKLAILDPKATTPDLVFGNPVMKEVLTITGVTPDSEFPSFPNAVREWCINTAAVDPFTKSVLANSEDGRLYRWDLTTNTFSQVITLTGGIGESYTPTLIGIDGTVYAINRGVLFALGE